MSITMKQLTAGKTGKVLQECRNLIINLRQNGRGMDEFLKYMEGLDLHARQREQEQQQSKAEYARKAPKCPKCQGVMYCYPVNTGPEDQIEGDWKSYWLCGNPECGHDIDSLNDVTTEMKKYGLGG